MKTCNGEEVVGPEIERERERERRRIVGADLSRSAQLALAVAFDTLEPWTACTGSWRFRSKDAVCTAQASILDVNGGLIRSLISGSDVITFLCYRKLFRSCVHGCAIRAKSFVTWPWPVGGGVGRRVRSYEHSWKGLVCDILRSTWSWPGKQRRLTTLFFALSSSRRRLDCRQYFPQLLRHG